MAKKKKYKFSLPTSFRIVPACSPPRIDNKILERMDYAVYDLESADYIFRYNIKARVYCIDKKNVIRLCNNYSEAKEHFTENKQCLNCLYQDQMYNMAPCVECINESKWKEQL